MYLYQDFPFSQFNETMSSVSCFYPYYEFLSTHLYLYYNLFPEDRIQVSGRYNFVQLSGFNNPLLCLSQSIKKQQWTLFLTTLCMVLSPQLWFHSSIPLLPWLPSIGGLFRLCRHWFPHTNFYSAPLLCFGISLLPQKKTQWIKKFGQPRT